MSDTRYPTRMHEVLGVGTMTDTEDYIVFDRTGTPHVVVAVKTEIGGNCPQSGNREVEG